MTVKISIFILSLFILLLSACAKQQAEQGLPTEEITTKIEALTERVTELKEQISAQGLPQTGYTVSVPSEYTKASSKPGTVVRVDYDSEDYVRGGGAITKTAYVYTPYGYDENDTDTKYDILYLMHGWGGHAGEYFEFASQKNMFDNLIERGEIKPLIIVSATFYN